MTNAQPALSIRLSTLRLGHGQAMRVITDTRLMESISSTALDAMIKKLRREGVPFGADELIKDTYAEMAYGYVHLIELAVAMKMQSDGLAFRHVVSLLTTHRSVLRGFYRDAMLEASTGRGTVRILKNPSPRNGGTKNTALSGLYLDFRAVNSNGILGSPGPELLGPWQALERQMGSYDGLYPYPLIMLSQICERVLRIAEATPLVKRGRKA